MSTQISKAHQTAIDKQYGGGSFKVTVGTSHHPDVNSADASDCEASCITDVKSSTLLSTDVALCNNHAQFAARACFTNQLIPTVQEKLQCCSWLAQLKLPVSAQKKFRKNTAHMHLQDGSSARYTNIKTEFLNRKFQRNGMAADVLSHGLSGQQI
jgi:hypothetical protein